MVGPLGAQEVASLLGVQDRTVHQWLRRGLLPDAEFPSINGSRAWERDTILRWAGTTGRLADATLRQECEHRLRVAPLKPRKGGRLPSPDVAARRQRAEAERLAKAMTRTATELAEEHDGYYVFESIVTEPADEVPAHRSFLWRAAGWRDARFSTLEDALLKATTLIERSEISEAEVTDLCAGVGVRVSKAS